MNPTTPRLAALDMGRGLAVFLMMLVHTLWMYADKTTQSASLLGQVIHFIGKGTPSFLIIMGMSFMLSSRQSLNSALTRGAMILMLAFGMNILKFVVPISVFGTMPQEFIAAYGWSEPLNLSQLFYLALTGDILQLAGVSLFFLALIRHYIKNKYLILLIAFAILSVSREVSGYRPGIVGLDYVSDLFFSASYQVYFPVFPWISFILFGMFMGIVIQENNGAPAKLFKKLPLVAGLTLITGGALCYMNFDYHFGNFFHLGPGGVIYLLGINLILLWSIQKLLASGINSRMIDLLFYFSKRVTSLYIIQWVLICWGMGIIGFQSLGAIDTLAMMPVVVVLSLSVQRVVDMVKTWRSSPQLSTE